MADGVSRTLNYRKGLTLAGTTAGSRSRFMRPDLWPHTPAPHGPGLQADGLTLTALCPIGPETVPLGQPLIPPGPGWERLPIHPVSIPPITRHDLAW